MARRADYDLQLEHILITAARDHQLPLIPPDWHKPGDLQGPLPVIVEQMLRYAAMTLVGDKRGHTPDTLRIALQECARLHAQLYDFLVAKLYSSISGKTLEASYYEADDFLVMIFTGDVAPVVEVLGQEIAPFVLRHYRSLNPVNVPGLADAVLKSLYADPEPPLRDGIIKRVQPMLTMRLRPLPLDLSEVPPPDTRPFGSETIPADSLLDDPYQPDTGVNAAAQEPRPARQADVSPRRTLRAPLPDWRSKDRPDDK